MYEENLHFAKFRIASVYKLDICALCLLLSRATESSSIINLRKIPIKAQELSIPL